MAFDFTQGETVSPATTSGGFNFQNGEVVPNTPTSPSGDTGAITPPSWGESIGTQAAQGKQQFQQATSDIMSGKESPVQGLESGLKAESGLASFVSSPLAPIFGPISKAVKDVGSKIADVGDTIGSNPTVQSIANANPQLTDKVLSGAERVSTDLANAGNVAGTIAGVDQAVKAAPDLYSNVAQAVKDKISTPPEQLDSNIVDSYTKAVKPSIAGKVNPGQMDKYNSDVTSAVKSIVANKENLSFETDSGTETSRVPQTRGELADAVAQTKKSIFDQYDAIAKKAGEKGATVDLGSVSKSLDPVINNEALKISNPSAIKYAQGIQDRLQNPDGTPKSIDAKTAQDVIQNYNAALKAFYRNPTYDAASTAAIDAHVVNQIRSGLDDVIQKATGEDYQGLKNQYGSLSAIEKDVNKSALAEAKGVGSNTSGLGKYVDIFSGGDIVSGLLSLNPALIAKGVGQTIFSRALQYLNSPERAIGKMFDAAQGKSLGNTVASSIDTTPAAGLSMRDVSNNIKVKSPLDNMHPEDQDFLSKAAGQIQSGKLLPVKDWELMKATMKNYGYQVPETQAKAADFLLTAKDSADAKAFNASLDKSMKSSNPTTGQDKVIQSLSTAGSEQEAYVKSGDYQKELVYKPDGSFTAPVAAHVVDDLAGKLQRAGLDGGTFKKGVDLSNPTRQNLIDQATKFLKTSGKQPRDTVGRYAPKAPGGAPKDAMNPQAGFFNPTAMMSDVANSPVGQAAAVAAVAGGSQAASTPSTPVPPSQIYDKYATGATYEGGDLPSIKISYDPNNLHPTDFQLPANLRGPVASFAVNEYEKLFKYKTGILSYPRTRTEDTPDGTRRLILISPEPLGTSNKVDMANLKDAQVDPQLQKDWKAATLNQVVASAKADGMKELQIPTAETQKLIEGKDPSKPIWTINGENVKDSSQLKVGDTITQPQNGRKYIVTGIPNSGSFMGILDARMGLLKDRLIKSGQKNLSLSNLNKVGGEEFSLSSDNVITLEKFLDSSFKPYTDPQGVTWYRKDLQTPQQSPSAPLTSPNVPIDTTPTDTSFIAFIKYEAERLGKSVEDVVSSL